MAIPVKSINNIDVPVTDLLRLLLLWPILNSSLVGLGFSWGIVSWASGLIGMLIGAVIPREWRAYGWKYWKYIFVSVVLYQVQ